MDVKRKTCDIRTREKHLFLDIFSTNTYPIALPVRRNSQHRSLLTVVPVTSLLVSTSSSSAKYLPLSFEPFYRMNISHGKQGTFILCPGSFSRKKITRELCSSVVYSSSTVTILSIETSL
jgi:hypothetical protein